MRSFRDRLLPAPVEGGFRRDDAWIWCGSVMRDDTGAFHMFASMWDKSLPFNPNWLTNSRVVHAVSRSPEGPYRYQDDALPPRGREYWDGMMTHNPTIHRSGELFLLFYTGTTYSADHPTASALVTTSLGLEARRNQRIGLAVAPSLNGPWRRFDAPCIDVRPGHWDSFLTTNPAPCVGEDGRILMLYKSTDSHTARIRYGVAAADSAQAPFHRLGPDRPITFGNPDASYEDAFIWRQDGLYQMLFNDMTGAFTGEDHAGAHAISEDGIEWRLNEPPRAYSRTVRWADGRVTVQGSLERPQLLIQNGAPTHFFAATADGPGGFWNALNTWNMVIPLAD